MNKNRYKKHSLFSKILMVILGLSIPVAAFLVLNGIAKSIQPVPLMLGEKEDVPVETYIDPDQTYYLTGDIECYPKMIISPNNFDYYEENKTTIHSLGDVRSEECKKGDNYVATLRFYLNIPGNIPYAIRFPGEFCEYILFSNRVTSAYTTTFRSDDPVYPAPRYIEFPFSESGEYEIVLYVITPTNSVNSTKGTILFGSQEHISKICDNDRAATIIHISIMAVVMIFFGINTMAIRRDNILGSFTLLTAAFILRTLMRDYVMIMDIFPHLSYQLGTIFSGLTMPLLLVSLVYYGKCLFPSLFPKYSMRATIVVLMIPFIDALTFNSVFWLNILTEIAYVIPFGICLYVFIKSHLKKYPNSILWGTGVLLLVISGGLDISSSRFPVPVNYTHTISFFAFAILELTILARRYANQYQAEDFYTEELKRTLEEMQASENAFLNAQMKPHFLYNTLNTIADLCVTDSQKAKSMISSLKEYCQLILSIDNVEKTVPLSQEMELVTAYTSIEHERFPSINFYNDFPLRMPTVDMPPLTLQPLIENAIKHGVRKSDKPGVITLRIKDSFDSVTFYVSDNGVGMNEETISKLFEAPKEYQSIGVYNIDKRLKNLYHKGLSVESTVGLGTCISFSVPK